MFKLKPCPVCGGEAEIIQWYIKGIANRKHYRVQCSTCKHYYLWQRRRLEKAISDWNERCV